MNQNQRNERDTSLTLYLDVYSVEGYGDEDEQWELVDTLLLADELAEKEAVDYQLAILEVSLEVYLELTRSALKDTDLNSPADIEQMLRDEDVTAKLYDAVQTARRELVV